MSPKKLKKLFILRKPAKNFAKSSKFLRNEIFAIVKFFEETSEINFCRNSPNLKKKKKSDSANFYFILKYLKFLKKQFQEYRSQLNETKTRISQHPKQAMNVEL